MSSNALVVWIQNEKEDLQQFLHNTKYIVIFSQSAVPVSFFAPQITFYNSVSALSSFWSFLERMFPCVLLLQPWIPSLSIPYFQELDRSTAGSSSRLFICFSKDAKWVAANLAPSWIFFVDPTKPSSGLTETRCRLTNHSTVSQSIIQRRILRSPVWLNRIKSSAKRTIPIRFWIYAVLSFMSGQF